MVLRTNPPDRYVTRRCGSLNLHEHLQTQIRQWQRGRLNGQDLERVIVFTGWPGVGKTTLLRSLAAAHGGVYLDLEKKHPTPMAFVHTARAQIEEKAMPPGRWFRLRPSSPGALLLLDNVPRSDDGYFQDAFNEHILKAEIDQKPGLLIAAMRHPDEWGIPREHGKPYILRGLTRDGIREVIRLEEWGDAQPYLDAFGTLEEHLPVLAKSICTIGELGEGLRNFLRKWVQAQKTLVLEENGLQQEANEMLRLFLAMDLMDLWERDYIWDDWEELAPALKRSGLDIPVHKVGTILSRLRWIEYRQTEDGKMALRWVEPVRQTLQLLTQSAKDTIAI